MGLFDRIRKPSNIKEERNEDKIAKLIETLDDLDTQTQWEVIPLLGESGDKRCVEPLIAFITQPNKHSHSLKLAMDALVNLKDPRAIEPIIIAFKKKEQHATISHFYEFGDIALEPLLSVINDENEKLRSEAIYALGYLKNPKAVNPLIQALINDNGKGFFGKDNDNRNRAAYALEQIGEPSVAALESLKDHENSVVRELALESLEGIANSNE